MSTGAPSAARLRLMTDLKLMRQEPPEGCSASPMSEENLFVWSATIFGPPETPWEGGVYSLRLTFNDQYPEKPPRVRFTAEMFHPNVYTDGTLCLDIIQDKWSPIYTVNTILTSIQSLLTDPNPSSPANPEAAQLYNTDINSYKKKACERKSVGHNQGKVPVHVIVPSAVCGTSHGTGERVKVVVVNGVGTIGSDSIIDFLRSGGLV